MSIHVSTSEEAQERLKKQKTASTITSVLVSLVVIALLGTVLGLLTILIPSKEVETIISYQAPAIEEETTNEPKVRVQQRQVPTPPSAASAVANVITTTAPTSVSIPDTNTMTNVESPDFGSMDDFGMGFGMEEAMSSSTSFFGAKVTGTKICYVIDYSLSMRGKREALMRVELANSIENLKGGAEYSLLFFAGPVWQASDQLVIDDQRIVKTIQEDGKEVNWNKKFSLDEREQRKFRPQWIKPTATNIEKSLEQIKSTPLVLGTEWGKPLRAAFDLKPSPDVIIFMTDGSSGKSSTAISEEIGKLAKRKSITVNCIALMEPKAKDDLKRMADMTGGTAMMVRNEQEIEDLTTGEVTQR